MIPSLTYYNLDAKSLDSETNIQKMSTTAAYLSFEQDNNDRVAL